MVGAGDVRVQTERVLENLGAVLAAAGASFASVVKTTIFLADLQDFGTVNEVYARYFGEPRPRGRPFRPRACPRAPWSRSTRSRPSATERPQRSARGGRRGTSAKRRLPVGEPPARRAPRARRRGPRRSRPAPGGTRPRPTSATSGAARPGPQPRARSRASFASSDVDRLERRAVERRVALGDERRDAEHHARRDARQLQA